MAQVDFLCLASSYKHGGRCVAGLRLDTGQWVRPVSQAQDGTLSEQSCWVTPGMGVRPLDCVKVDLAAPRPVAHQPEDCVLGPGGFSGAVQTTLDEVAPLLNRSMVFGPDLLGDTSRFVSVGAIPPDGLTASLALVRVEAPKFVTRSNYNGQPQLRVQFVLGGATYDLPVTDLEPWAVAARQGTMAPTVSDWYLVVSLAEPMDDGRCFKLVAAAIEIPFARAVERVLRIWTHHGGHAGPASDAQRERMLASPEVERLSELPTDVLVRSLRLWHPRNFKAWLAAAQVVGHKA